MDKLDARIANLNQERYTLAQTSKRIQSALEEDQILFNPLAAERLFAEAGVLFPEQLAKDFNQLISFNRAITDERRRYLADELVDLNKEMTRVGTELINLLDVIREYSAFGLQQIITAIDSDLPSVEKEMFKEDEIIARLNDEGDEGRLFKMPPW